MLLTSAFSRDNSDISLEEFNVCTAATMKLRVKASASRAEDPGFESRLRRDFSGVESYQ